MLRWPTARNLLRKIRTAMKQRNSIYRLENIIEMDDALVCGKRPGKGVEEPREKSP